ncbi:hypothetical protein AX17_002526 [Amanita inopinata Kibby_2008]|nr:hypothetical protein AX17_002526 [Amanita inopinata Kibby_2008]
MFTPPPSPQPAKTTHSIARHSSSQPHSSPDDLSGIEHQAKKAVGRRTRWSVILIPFILVFITLSTRYFTHPVAFDLLVQPLPSLSWKAVIAKGADFRPHKRHLELLERWDTDSVTTISDTMSGTQSASALTADSPTDSSTPTPTTTSTTAPSLEPPPTVPSSPPALPTPFPQPFSAGIVTDNISVSCANFFTNMTNSLAFRSCRPFSLLLQSSGDFVDAQSSITLTNALIWGTCNVVPGKDQCVANMGWFASQLEIACAKEVQNKMTMATDALTGLQAYGLMYEAACHTDPSTNVYCYVDAVHNSNPSDLYLYQMPIGIAYPNNTKPTCSSCSKDLVRLYVSALQDPNQAASLKALSSNYGSGARVLETQCGETFAVINNSGVDGLVPSRWSIYLFIPLLSTLTWLLTGTSL